MCRFIGYLGHPLRLSQLITEPEHSLIQQSYQARERPEPLNGDGFGVAWFVPEFSPTPALFKDVSPAWSNENLRELSKVTSSRCILAHVRAASPQSPVNRLNCHPFSQSGLAFMHNGYLADFGRWRRSLLNGLSDAAFEVIRGSTDSEHAFALFCDFYWKRPESVEPLLRLSQSLVLTIQRLELLRQEAGVLPGSYFNFLVADGENMVATRFASHRDEPPPSLHYATGRNLRCERGKIQLDQTPDSADVAMIVSEETGPEFCWEQVPPNHLVLAQHPGEIELRPIEIDLTIGL
ncbi:class II glutamine amidotransferase [bacterium]|nr:class II glutamine amidotransferase [bacterium]